MLLKRLSVDALLGDLGLSCWTQAGGTSTGQLLAMDQSGGLVDHQLLFRSQNPNSWTTSEGLWGYIDTWTISRQSVPKCLIFMATRTVARRPHATLQPATLHHRNGAPGSGSTPKMLHNQLSAIAQYGTPWIGGRGLASAWPQMRKVMRLKQSGSSKKTLCCWKELTLKWEPQPQIWGYHGVPNVPTPYPDLPEPAQSCKRLTCWKSLKLPSQPGGHSISLCGLLLTVQFLFAAVRSLPVAVRNASTSICSSGTSTGKSCLPDSRHRTSYDILCG